jgi:hypothetical protein
VERTRDARAPSPEERYTLHARDPSTGMYPLRFRGRIEWREEALAILMPDDNEALLELPDAIWVQDRRDPGVFFPGREPRMQDVEDNVGEDNAQGGQENQNDREQNLARYIPKGDRCRLQYIQLIMSSPVLAGLNTNIQQ